MGILREFWGVWKVFSRDSKKRGNISNLNLAFTRFDTEQWWDGFSWWFWIWAFPSMNILFYILFYGKCAFFKFTKFTTKSHIPCWLGCFNRRSIGKKRIITYGLDENRSAISEAWKQGGEENKTEREIKRAKLKVVTILRKKMWKTWRRKKIITDNDHSLRQIFHLVLFEFFSWRGDNRGGGFRAG